MSQEMKLLTALCEALGFEVVTDLDYKERKECQSVAMEINLGQYNGDRVLMSEGQQCKLRIDKNGLYTSLLKSPVVSYSLKRSE